MILTIMRALSNGVMITLAALLKTIVGRGREAKKENRETGKEAKAIIQQRNAGGQDQGRGCGGGSWGWISDGRFYVSTLLDYSPQLFNQTLIWGASLVVRGLIICLPVQGTRVRSPVQEDPTCHGTTKPVCHNCWSTRILVPVCPNEKPVHCNQRTAPTPATGGRPRAVNEDEHSWNK